MLRASGTLTTALGGLALIGALASCARHAEPVAVAPAPVAPPRPVLAAAYGGVVVPPQGSDGRYRTINAGIGEQRAIWHVRAALNVAALSCRGPENAGIVAAYNSLLTGKKAVLAKANKAVTAEFRGEGGDWQDAHDRYMTRLYNYFAMPQATANFCRTAATLAPRAAQTPAADFATFAPTALLELDAPILAVYQAIDAYKVQLADWEARYGPDALVAPAAVQVAASPAEPARKVKKGKARLDYASVETVFAWESQPNTAVALR